MATATNTLQFGLLPDTAKAVIALAMEMMLAGEPADELERSIRELADLFLTDSLDLCHEAMTQVWDKLPGDKAAEYNKAFKRGK
jgi:hypothetical protein